MGLQTNGRLCGLIFGGRKEISGCICFATRTGPWRPITSRSSRSSRTYSTHSLPLESSHEHAQRPSSQFPSSSSARARRARRRVDEPAHQSAVGEKLAALMTEDYVARARRGSRKAYEHVLRRVPDVAPEERDKLSNKMQARSATARRRGRRS